MVAPSPQRQRRPARQRYAKWGTVFDRQGCGSGSCDGQPPPAARDHLPAEELAQLARISLYLPTRGHRTQPHGQPVVISEKSPFYAI